MRPRVFSKVPRLVLNSHPEVSEMNARKLHNTLVGWCWGYHDLQPMFCTRNLVEVDQFGNSFDKTASRTRMEHCIKSC